LVTSLDADDKRALAAIEQSLKACPYRYSTIVT